MSKDLVLFNREIQRLANWIETNAPDEQTYDQGMQCIQDMRDQVERLNRNAITAINITIEQRNAMMRDYEELKAWVEYMEAQQHAAQSSS